MRLIFSKTVLCLFLGLAATLSGALGGGLNLATAQPMGGGYATGGDSPMEGGALAHPPMYYERALVNPPEGSALAHANTFAGDALENMMRGRVNKTAGILAATMVNLDNLDQSSSFGRLTMQQIGSRLSQYGYRVMDVRLRADMAIRPDGEFMLSRDVAQLMQSNYGAEAVLVGVYSIAGANVYCSVRVLRLSDSAVVAAYEYYLPRRGDTARLLRGSGNGALGYAMRQPAFSASQPVPPVQRQ